MPGEAAGDEGFARVLTRLRACQKTLLPLHPRSKLSLMGIVASDTAPWKKSDICTRGKRFPAHQFTQPKWCPIFISFSREGGVFRPYFPAIEAMIANLERVVETGGIK
jgi:hypothetical protein